MQVCPLSDESENHLVADMELPMVAAWLMAYITEKRAAPVPLQILCNLVKDAHLQRIWSKKKAMQYSSPHVALHIPALIDSISSDKNVGQ